MSKNEPYYIYAPDYRQSSAGIRALHYLCHFLNEIGCEAYVYPAIISNPHLRTPILTQDTIHRHFISGRNPIAVYPEIVSGNPLFTTTVARWLLNIPGLLGGDAKLSEDELIFFYAPWVSPKYRDIDLLCIPTVDTRIFNNRNNIYNNCRSGFCFYANKFIHQGGIVDPYHIENGISLCQDIRRSPEEIASILRKSEAIYCYEQSAIMQEAFACGCVVIIATNDYWEQSKWGRRVTGARLDTDTDIIDLVKAEVRENLPYPDSVSWPQIDRFINRTQAAAQYLKETSGNISNYLSKDIWLTKEESRPQFISMLNMLYSEIFNGNIQRESFFYHGNPINLSQASAFPAFAQKWLDDRKIIESNVNSLAINESKEHNPTRFHLLVRVSDSQRANLADTFDSLIAQQYEHWHLDILSTLEAPDGLEDIPCIGWHTAEKTEQTNLIVHSLGVREGCDWIIELPPGAILDPLYLWRLADEINRHPDIKAFFVDDYTLDEDGICTQLRLKPGLNIEHLRSMDLAGPICVHQEAWVATCETSLSDGSPWFSKLLGIADKFGWASIKHIPEALITYPEAFPSDPRACLTALIGDMKSKGSIGEIIPVSGNSWNIRYPLNVMPRITIVILSQGQLDLLSRCLDSIIEKTSYRQLEILISLPREANDPDLAAWLLAIQQGQPYRIRSIKAPPPGKLASRCNAAVKNSPNDFVLLIREEAVIIQEKWLEELLRTCLQPDVAAVSPCLIKPGSSLIENSGYVLGLNGLIGSPYQGEAKLGDHGYLDYLRVARDVSALPRACMLVRKSAYLETGGMDEIELGDHLADADLCLKLRRNNQRLIFQPLATVVYEGSTQFDIESDITLKSHEMLAEAKASEAFSKRWLPNAAVDPFFNPNLSLVKKTPTPETDYRAQWQYLPSTAPRFLARPLPNVQGIFRITSPLSALCRQGKASQCSWPMEDDGRELTVPELRRLSPNSVIVQHYLSDKQLATLQAWHSVPGRPFIVYALDDLVSNLAKSNPFFKNMSANNRGRLKYALERCDRLVASTDFLAETYRHFCSDIRVVPNRLEQEIWLPLQSRKNTSKKPRIGWAGGTTHQGDLLLLKEVIEQTQSEADWIFFGMCPNEIRPLLAEYHPETQFANYPASLAALNLDIAVAPLAQLPFNQGKSNLRLLEYGILGIPVICTDIEPYRNSPACRVTNTPEAWIKALRERIYDANARKSEGATLRQWVQQHYLLENHLDQWLSAHLSSQ